MVQYRLADYLEESGETALSFEELSANQTAKAANAYAGRKSNNYEPGAGDLQLHETLRLLENETNPLVREQLELRAQKLAAQSVATEQRSSRRRRTNHQPDIQLSDPTEIGGEQSVMSRPYGFMQAKYGRDVVQSNLSGHQTTWMIDYRSSK